MTLLKEVEREIEETASHSLCKEDPLHSKLTRKWVLRLKADAGEALQIAALAHDIDRAAGEGKEKVAGKKAGKPEEWNPEEHAKRSAEIISKILEKHGYDESTISRVKYLVERHESGGDEEADILRDADSISYFEHNIYFYYDDFGEKKTKEKINFMFNRDSDNAKDIIKNLEFKAKKIEQLFRETISS